MTADQKILKIPIEKEAFRIGSATEEALFAFVQITSSAAALVDLDLRILVANQHWCNLYGLSMDSSVGSCLPELFPIDRTFDAQLREALDGCGTAGYGDLARRPDGSSIWVQWEFTPWRDDAQRVNGLLITTRDVSAPVLAQKALEESEERLRTALDVAQAIVWDIDLTTMKISITGKNTYLLGEGWTYEVWLEDQFAFIHPDDRADVERQWRAGLVGGVPVLKEYRANRPDNPDIWVESTVRVMHIPDKGPVRAIGVARDITARKVDEKARAKAEQTAARLARHDVLTGLPNRRQLNEALDLALSARSRTSRSHALLLLDLNGFKRVNDLYGHPIGDDVLVKVGERIKAAVRQGDLVSRIGGDEFAVLAREIDGPAVVRDIAVRIIENLGEGIETSFGLQHIGVAIGIALTPQDAATKEELFRAADLALYQVKAEGRSSLKFFEREMEQKARERDMLERELRAAIGTPALRPFYQPVVDLRTGEISGFEALARWTHSQMGNIVPDRFIPVANESGLIGPLTHDLLRQACREAASWPENMSLSFNISPVQLRDDTLGLHILGLLSEAGLSPGRLEIEVTETALVQDLDAAQRLLGTLREAGVRIALDDFGTGYSSLYHLRNFQCDKIKIDKSFIQGILDDRASTAIVAALVGLASGLSMTVTAEGVEMAEQKDLLIEQGCSQGQGFLFSQAISGEDVRRLLGEPVLSYA